MKTQKNKLLASTITEQKTNILISVKVDQIKKTTPVDLVLCIDRSSSMGGEKLNMIKTSLRYLLDELSGHDRVAIVVFNEVGERLTPLTRMTPEGKKAVLKSLDTIKPKGPTNISLGLAHALYTL